MRNIKVNPNRMELLKLKRRLAVAERGWQLLKEKRDTLTQKFLNLARKNFQLRREIEENLKKAYQFLELEAAFSGGGVLNEAFLKTEAPPELELAFGNLVGVRVPQYGFRLAARPHTYGYLATSSFLDQALLIFQEILPRLIELGELEKTVSLLAEEIERTRRRVNALEYILIPGLKETIKFIVDKLDQLERSGFVTLLKMEELVKK